MYRFDGRKKVFYKGIKRYHALVEDQSTGKIFLTNKHFRRAIEADQYGERAVTKLNTSLFNAAVRDAQQRAAQAEADKKVGGLIGSEEAVGAPAIIQTPAA